MVVLILALVVTVSVGLATEQAAAFGVSVHPMLIVDEQALPGNTYSVSVKNNGSGTQKIAVALGWALPRQDGGIDVLWDVSEVQSIVALSHQVHNIPPDESVGIEFDLLSLPELGDGYPVIGVEVREGPFLGRLAVPVLVQSSDSWPELSLESFAWDAGQVRLAVANDGTGFSQSRAQVVFLDAEDVPVAVENLSGFVFPGQKRIWRLAPPPAAVRATLETQSGTHQITAQVYGP